LLDFGGSVTPSHRGKVKDACIMNIGAASKASGVSAKMVRHYEAIGLLRPAGRRANSYREYGLEEVHELRFIGRARKLGFALPEIAALLALWRNKQRSSREVRQLAAAHLVDLEQRIAEMQSIATSLRQLVHACHGDDRAACPILDDLSGQPGLRVEARDGDASEAAVMPLPPPSESVSQANPAPERP
jgi:Cu(I)-responsive transcriptional regulator